MSKWQLYVWEDVLCDYTCGMAFAIARDKEEAVNALRERATWGFSSHDIENGELTIHELPKLSLKEPIAYSVYGGG